MRLINLVRVFMVAILASVALPAAAKDVTLQVVAMSYDQGIVNWLSGSARNQRVLELGPKVFDGVARGKYQAPSRNIPLTFFIWMKPGFENVPAVHEAVDGMTVEKINHYAYRGSRLDFESTKYQAQFRRDYSSLPYAMSGINASPDFAVVTSLDDYAVGLELKDGFLRQVEMIMICPSANTVWPRRTGGQREGLIITHEEIARWLSRGFQTPTAGIVDSK